MTWPMAEAWRISVDLVAATYGVSAQSITAESRGRGPRPPEAVRIPKKVALYLTTCLSGCDYAALARHVGLHKDTVTTHCAWAREMCCEDEDLEHLISVLGSAAIVRMQLTGLQTMASPANPAERRSAADRLRDLREFMDGVFENALEALSDEAGELIRPIRPSSDNHGNVIAISASGRNR